MSKRETSLFAAENSAKQKAENCFFATISLQQKTPRGLGDRNTENGKYCFFAVLLLFLFSHPDFTVGQGISPCRERFFSTLRRLYCRYGITPIPKDITLPVILTKSRKTSDCKAGEKDSSLFLTKSLRKILDFKKSNAEFIRRQTSVWQEFGAMEFHQSPKILFNILYLIF